MLKYKLCPHCKCKIEKHHHTLHVKQCYLSPDNLKKIATLLKNNILNVKALSRASFYRWARENAVLTSITITSRLGFFNWDDALYQLMIYCALSGEVNYEYMDMMYATLNETLGLPIENYRTYYYQSVNKSTSEELQESLHYNRLLLLLCVIGRAKRDIEADGELDENKEVIDKQDAYDFLKEFTDSAY